MPISALIESHGIYMEQLKTTDGTTIHYHHLGQGSPLIILHGWTSSSRDWLQFAEQLSAHHEVFCWDARGHALHAIDQSCNTDIRHMAKDLALLIETHQLSDVTLVGHSMGALTSWEYIHQFGTQALSSLCIIDQSPKLVTDTDWPHGIYSNFCHEKKERFQQRLHEDFAEAVLELVAFGHNERSKQNYLNNSEGFQQMRRYLSKLSSGPLSRCWQSLTDRDYRQVLSQIDIPTLLIYGDESQFYSLELANWVHQQIQGSELKVYSNADHSPHLWHKERFIDDLLNFSSSTNRV